MADVRLLIIDESSFLSVETIEKLDEHRMPSSLALSDRSGHTLLRPRLACSGSRFPLHAYRCGTAPLGARSHRFRTIVELDQPFRQAMTIPKLAFQAVQLLGGRGGWVHLSPC